jgi:hypothetical protein
MCSSIIELFSSVRVSWARCNKNISVDVKNKLECLSLAGLTSLVKCLWVRPGAYPREEYLKGASLR